MQTINRVRRGLNPYLRADDVILDHRTRLSWDVSQALRSSYAGKLRIFETENPVAIRTAEAAAGKSIFAHDNAGKVTAAYKVLTKEAVDHGRQRACIDRDEHGR